MMKLHYHPMSGNSRRALLVAAHLDLPIERVIVDLTKGEQKSPPHVAKNPNGKVPVLEDDGFYLWESRAIMLHLAERAPGQTLLPTEPKAKADVLRWMFWDAQHMAPACAVLVAENFVKPLMGRGAPDAVEVKKGEALFAQFAGTLDAHLAGKEWITEGHLTLADFSIASGFALAAPAKFPMETGYANLKAWLARVQGTEAWKKTQVPVPGK